MMRKSQRKRTSFKRFELLLLILLSFLLLGNMALAKEEKEEKPEKTLEPTTLPSSPPSSLPSEFPTVSAQPTNVPSQFPSALPTSSPTVAPTTSPTTTFPPTTSPTERNTLRTEVYGAVIPILTFDVTLSDEEAILPMTRNIDSFFTMFIDRILEENSGTYEFDYSHLDSNVIVSVFQNKGRRRRRLETGYSIKIDGIAYYFGEAPRRESLIHSIQMYFNFWGKEDLEDYLHRLGLSSAKVAFVSIDEVPIDIFSEEEPPGKGSAQVGANVGPLENVETKNTSLPRVVAIAIYVVAILLIPLAALALLYYNKRRRQEQEKKASYWKRDNQSASETSQSEATPQSKHEQGHGDEEQSLTSSDLPLYQSKIPLYRPKKNYTKAKVSINGSSDKNGSDTSALVARGTYK